MNGPDLHKQTWLISKMQCCIKKGSCKGYLKQKHIYLKFKNIYGCYIRNKSRKTS